MPVCRTGVQADDSFGKVFVLVNLGAPRFGVEVSKISFPTQREYDALRHARLTKLEAEERRLDREREQRVHAAQVQRVVNHLSQPGVAIKDALKTAHKTLEAPQKAGHGIKRKPDVLLDARFLQEGADIEVPKRQKIIDDARRQVQQELAEKFKHSDKIQRMFGQVTFDLEMFEGKGVHLLEDAGFVKEALEGAAACELKAKKSECRLRDLIKQQQDLADNRAALIARFKKVDDIGQQIVQKEREVANFREALRYSEEERKKFTDAHEQLLDRYRARVGGQPIGVTVPGVMLVGVHPDCLPMDQKSREVLLATSMSANAQFDSLARTLTRQFRMLKNKRRQQVADYLENPNSIDDQVLASAEEDIDVVGFGGGGGSAAAAAGALVTSTAIAPEHLRHRIQSVAWIANRLTVFVKPYCSTVTRCVCDTCAASKKAK